MPDAWAGLLAANDNCSFRKTTYDNKGQGTYGQQPELTMARLDAALGRALDHARKPDRVSIQYDEEKSILNFDYLSDTRTYSFTVEAACEEGWFEWSESQKDQYLADSAQLEEFEGVYRVRQGIDSSLIVHAHGFSEYSTLFIFRDQEITEWWSRFQTAKANK